MSVVTLLALAAPAISLPAQRSAGVSVQVIPQNATTAGPLVTTTGVLRDRDLQSTIQSGFAARLEYTVELWGQRQWNDPLIDDAGWTVIVEFSPLSKQYVIRMDTAGGRSVSGPYATLDEVEAALAKPMQAPIRAPDVPRRMYYTVTLDIQPISWNELDELEAWLRGDVRPATRGQTNPVNAVVGLFRRLTLRVLGGGRTRYRESSQTFVPGNSQGGSDGGRR
jgi:hypothetical protein